VDTVARLGGDEFAVVLPEVGPADNATRVVEAIREALGRPYEIDGLRLTATASLGLALYPEDAAGAEALLAAADRAMYLAKRARVDAGVARGAAGPVAATAEAPHPS
jgi:diguanylate cyclase (GGDEF)-like protein